MISMCSKWLAESPRNIKNLEIIFPVVGHSFLPSDRIFGHIEKVVKKNDTIIRPDEYINIFKMFGDVNQLGESGFDVYDWKSEAQKTLKPTSAWHFKFKSTKRFILNRTKQNNILIKGEPFYKNDIGEFLSVFKKRQTVKQIKPGILPINVAVNPLKIKDVDKLLLTHFGQDWRDLHELQFYKEVIEPNISLTILQESEDEYCVEQQEDAFELCV